MCAQNKLRVKPAPLSASEKMEIAAEAVVNGVGKRTYAICSVVMRQVGCSRRTAYRLVTRARERLAEKTEKRLKELGSVLPALWGDALRSARAEGDHKAVVRLLALAADMTGKLPAQTGDEPITGIEFVIGELDEKTGEVVPKRWAGNDPPAKQEDDTSR